MEVKVVYSKSQLEACINFIAENNDSFLGEHDKIRQNIIRSIDRLVADYPKYSMTGTMGYYVNIGYVRKESIEHDENEIFIEFTVDPGLAVKNWTDNDYHSYMVILEKFNELPEDNA